MLLAGCEDTGERLGTFDAILGGDELDFRNVNRITMRIWQHPMRVRVRVRVGVGLYPSSALVSRKYFTSGLGGSTGPAATNQG